MMGHEMEALGQRLVTGGACQDVRNPQDAPVEFFFASPGAEGHIVVDLVRVDTDQGEAPVRCQRIGDGIQVREGRAGAGFEARSDGIPGELVGVRDLGRLRMLAYG